MSGSQRQLESSQKPAIILLSGGLDSATTAVIARDNGFDLYALSFDYGQRHAIELQAARRIAHSLPVHRHVVQQIDMRTFGGSALTADIEVPKDRQNIGHDGNIPVTYVPARNTIFLAFALCFAETIGAQDIFIGVNALDYSGYPDCRPEFISKFEELARLATKAGVQGQAVKIHAPLIHMSKAEIIKTGVRLGVDYKLTTSCYDPHAQGLACGRCDSCHIRREGFQQAGVQDPTHYRLAAG